MMPKFRLPRHVLFFANMCLGLCIAIFEVFSLAYAFLLLLIKGGRSD